MVLQAAGCTSASSSSRSSTSEATATSRVGMAPLESRPERPMRWARLLLPLDACIPGVAGEELPEPSNRFLSPVGSLQVRVRVRVRVRVAGINL